MPEETQPVEVAQGIPHRWQEGHEKYGGRRKRTAQQARALADELGVDPLKFMLLVVKSDTIEQTVIEGGKEKRVQVVIPLEMRIDCAKHVSRFLYPVLSATQVTGADDGPVNIATLDMAKLLANPAMLEMVQKLALAMAEQELDQQPTPKLPPGPVDLSQDHAGRWSNP
jgi:hypothetical protein